MKNKFNSKVVNCHFNNGVLTSQILWMKFEKTFPLSLKIELLKLTFSTPEVSLNV